MATDQIATYLKYANLQMAAEAFLTNSNGTIKTGKAYITALTDGNGHASRFTDVLARKIRDTPHI